MWIVPVWSRKYEQPALPVVGRGRVVDDVLATDENDVASAR